LQFNNTHNNNDDNTHNNNNNTHDLKTPHRSHGIEYHVVSKETLLTGAARAPQPDFTECSSHETSVRQHYDPAESRAHVPAGFGIRNLQLILTIRLCLRLGFYDQSVKSGDSTEDSSAWLTAAAPAGARESSITSAEMREENTRAAESSRLGSLSPSDTQKVRLARLDAVPVRLSHTDGAAYQIIIRLLDYWIIGLSLDC
jgi:hypothetical protein